MVRCSKITSNGVVLEIQHPMQMQLLSNCSCSPGFRSTSNRKVNRPGLTTHTLHVSFDPNWATERLRHPNTILS